AAGVGTMEGVAYGWRGRNPAAIASFIITRDISPSVNLHDYTAGWKDAPPSRALKSMLIGRVADMTGRMHRSGLNHRDCYLCHFLLSLPFDGREENLRLSLIDLHRAQIRPAVPRRWRDKDLAALFYSSRHLGLTRSDYARFLTAYFQKPLREVMRQEASSLARIAGRSERIRARSQRKGA
ncbi:MAG: lipopolysaccharide core heptose(I) kinase RfaP, partial [Duodenibacillus sp.]|nr:lipopolysaccharide core heptose(I) kinase RfaP [Duodenibacillus sp.]